MRTLTIRNVAERVVDSLKQRSTEQEVRDLLEGHGMELEEVLERIEAGWTRQTRRPAAREVAAWKQQGRP